MTAVMWSFLLRSSAGSSRTTKAESTLNETKLALSLKGTGASNLELVISETLPLTPYDAGSAYAELIIIIMIFYHI